MRIQHNIMSINAYRYYNGNNKSLSNNLEKLSSGYRINRAADDAAGLAISEKMRAEITGLSTAQNNAQSGVNLVQTAEGALTEIHDMLNRMVELADQSANGTYDDTTDRANLEKEFVNLKGEIDRIAKASNFNGIQLIDGSMDASGAVSYEYKVADGTGFPKTTLDYSERNVERMYQSTITLGSETYEFVKEGSQAVAGNVAIVLDGTETMESALDKLVTAANKNAPFKSPGSYTIARPNPGQKVIITSTSKDAPAKALEPKQSGGGLILQIGGTADSCNQIAVNAKSVKSKDLGIDVLSVAEQGNAQDAVSSIKAAINLVSETRGSLGAAQNRLDHTINNLNVMAENIQDAESSIRDVDVAKEMMDYTKNNILVQSAQSMLAQANQAPQGVLQMLQQ